MTQPKLERGLIVANYGRHFLVETPEGERRICHSRGKKSTGLVGDRVLWQASEDEGTIEIDDNAVVSEGTDNGAYVAAWVWVYFDGTKFDKENEVTT